MPAGLGWDIPVEPNHRFRPGGSRSPFPGAPFMMGGHRDPLGAGTSLDALPLALHSALWTGAFYRSALP